MKAAFLALLLAGCAVSTAPPDATFDLVADTQPAPPDLTYYPPPDILPPVDAQLTMCDNPKLPLCTAGIAPFLGCSFGGRPVEDRACHRKCVACSTARDCQFEFGGEFLVCVGVCDPLNCP